MLGVVRDLRSPKSLADPADAADYQEHLLAEFVLARLAHGVADGTIRGELAAVEAFLASAGVWAWEVEPRHADRFLGHDQHGTGPSHPPRQGRRDRLLLPVPGAALPRRAARADRPADRLADRRGQPAPPQRRLHRPGAALAGGAGRVLRRLAWRAGHAAASG